MMEKIMNKQVTGQSTMEAKASRGDSLPAVGPNKKGKGPSDTAFESELSQAGVLAQQQQMQSVQVPKMAAEGSELMQAAQAPEANQVKILSSDGLVDKAQKSPLTLKSAVSTNTVSALTGLKPWSKEWTFQGESMGLETPEMGTPTPANALDSAALQAAQGASEKGVARPTRGEADAALNSKLDVLPLDVAMAQAKANRAKQANQPAGNGGEKKDPGVVALQGGLQSKGGVEAQYMQDLQRELLMSGMDATAAGKVLSAPDTQVQLMNGVVQGLKPATQAVKGSTLQQGALNSAFSGGEFLNTLNAVKGGGQNGSQSQDSMSQGQGQGKKLETKPNLRVIDGGAKGKKGVQFGDEPTLSQSLSNLAAGAKVGNGLAPAKTEVAAHVIQGANAEDRLSSESLLGVSSSIRNLSVQGGGEMRIRLKPDNLGELHVRVVTDGRNVGLHIQASDERSRKIIEESMSHLKDSMATQSLSLGAIEVSVSQAQSSAAANENRGDQSQSGNQAQGMFSDMLGNNGANNGSNSGRGAWGGLENEAASRSTTGGNGSATAAMNSRRGLDASRASSAHISGRLDVRA